MGVVRKRHRHSDVTVFCDAQGCPHYDARTTALHGRVAMLELELRVVGWSIGRKRALCPQHRRWARGRVVLAFEANGSYLDLVAAQHGLQRHVLLVRGTDNDGLRFESDDDLRQRIIRAANMPRDLLFGRSVG